MKEAAATIRVEFANQRLAAIVLEALKPETKTSPTQRSNVEIRRDGRMILLHFKARDTTALRASINSYTRWVMLVEDTLSRIRSL